MTSREICKSADHLFVPILEVSIPLLRCIHCDVFAYHDTVKQLAKNRSYRIDEEEPRPASVIPYWRRAWMELKRRFASAGPRLAGSQFGNAGSGSCINASALPDIKCHAASTSSERVNSDGSPRSASNKSRS